ncbi:MAG: hypothetical protein IMY72_06155 [Bacteroidetes bacterium]|nr:hypothetical protein [Bacteroidota bacterium]
MNIPAKKLELVRLILDTNNPSVLKSIKELFTKRKGSDFWDTLSQEQKKDIQEGLEEVERGEIVDYNEFMKEYQ